MSDPGPHPAAIDPDRLLAECAIQFTRRSGPGGQNRNKVETAVILTHKPTGLRAEASERRSQQENREAALFRLRLLLALERRTRRGPEAGPSPLWTARRRGSRIEVSPAHTDFPALLAEALDAVDLHDQDVAAAAEDLGVSTSQLVKLLKDEPRALRRLNDARLARGQHPLR